MESIGEKLRLARERNNLTIDQVARETHVAKRFLKALEDEDFAAFPGETYAMGFLRNYAEYLGLNADELVGIYRNIKIQEQPLPMNELLESQPRLPPLRIIIFAVAASARAGRRRLPHLPRDLARGGGPGRAARRSGLLDRFRLPGRGAHAVVHPGRRDLRPLQRQDLPDRRLRHR